MQSNQNEANKNIPQPSLASGPGLSAIAQGRQDIREVIKNHIERTEGDLRAASWLLAAIDTQWPQGEGPGFAPLPPEIDRVVSGVFNYLVNSRY